jgi:HrpA-like RNA helicase
VQDYMLEDVLSITGYIPPGKGKGKGRNGSGSQNRPRRATPETDSETSDVELEDEEREERTAKNAESKGGGDGDSSHCISIDDLVDRIDETNVNYDLLARLVKHLIVNKDPTDDGSVLVFLPGAPEINKAMEAIKRVTKELPTLRLLPLHGGLQPKDQNLVFRPAGAGLYKVILSTNVAET